MPPQRMRFARQALLLQIALVTVVVGVSSALGGWLLYGNLVDQYGQRALTLARSVAADPAMGDTAALDDPDGLIRTRAEEVRRATGALFVVVTEENGLRLSHPNPNLIGKRVSTDPSAALAGNEVVNVDAGTLGQSVRAKVPLRDSAGVITGEVSVGFDARDITTSLLKMLGITGVVAGGALLLGAVGSSLLTRRLKRLTLGLEPHELAELVQEQEAVLHGTSEGVLAVDAAGHVSVCNREAARLLGAPVSPGTPVTELDLPSPLRRALALRDEMDNLITVVGERVLVVNLRKVRRDGRDLGCVLTLRDRTDLEVLTSELASVRALSSALRSQQHEFANRLHTLAGLLQTDHHREAVEYLHEMWDREVGALGPGASVVRDPYLRAFLAAKTAAAAEKGVRIELRETSWLPTAVVAPVEVTTVVGNLVDNALEAARLGARRPAVVEVDLLAEGTTLHITVSDTGAGVPQLPTEEAFVAGVSTKEGEGRGLGLALTRQAARSLGGDVLISDPGGSEHGAVFVARLPGVLADDGSARDAPIADTGLGGAP